MHLYMTSISALVWTFFLRNHLRVDDYLSCNLFYNSFLVTSFCSAQFLFSPIFSLFSHLFYFSSDGPYGTFSGPYLRPFFLLFNTRTTTSQLQLQLPISVTVTVPEHTHAPQGFGAFCCLGWWQVMSYLIQ